MQALSGAPLAAYRGCGERDGGIGHGKRRSRGPREGATELGFPRPALGQMQGEAARRAGEPSGHREEAPPESLGGYHLLAQTDAHGPAGQVVGHHLNRQPSAVGGEAARGERVCRASKPTTMLEWERQFVLPRLRCPRLLTTTPAISSRLRCAKQSPL